MAKSAIAPPAFSVVSMLLAPVRALLRPTAMDGLFMPTFFVGPDWPEPLELLWRVLARLAAFAWLWPAVPARARAASLAVLLGGVYLQHIMMFSWYYAPWTLLGGIALGGVVQAALMTGPRFMPAVRIATAIAVVASVAVVACAVQTARVQRRLIHEQGLESIGLWLRANAQPRDTVFLEPLGYIGYYSGLKMLDFPGLSAPEVTRLIRGGKRNYRELIEALHPTWLVLRPTEVAGRRLQDSATLQRYDFVRAWDQQPELDAVRYLPNRRALEYDAVFLLFRRKPETASPPRGSGD